MSNDIRLFIGQAGGPNLYQLDSSFLDGAVRYGVLAQSTPVAPAGQSADTILYGAYLSVTLSMGVTLRITPVVDGVVLTQAARVVRLDSSTEERLERIEVGFAVPYTDENDPTFVLFNYAPRGIYVGIQVETLVNAPVNMALNGDLDTDSSGWSSIGTPIAGLRESSTNAPYGYESYWTCVADSAGDGVLVANPGSVRFPVVAGRTYEIRCQVCSEGNGLTDALYASIGWYTAGHVSVSNSLLPVFDVSGPFIWREMVWTVMAPPTAAECDISILNNLAFTWGFGVTGMEIREVTAPVEGLDATGYLSIDEAELDIESLAEGEPERTS